MNPLCRLVVIFSYNATVMIYVSETPCSKIAGKKVQMQTVDWFIIVCVGHFLKKSYYLVVGSFFRIPLGAQASLQVHLCCRYVRPEPFDLQYEDQGRAL